MTASPSHARTSPTTWSARATHQLLQGLALCLLLGFALFGQQARAETFKKISGDQLEKIMKAEGYAVKRDADGDIVWTSDGMRWLIIVSARGNAITAKFSVSEKPSLERINDWNRTKRFSRSYLDQDGDANLQLDLELDGGIERERILDFLRTASISRSAWMKEMF